MSSVDQALYETRAWLVKQFQKKQNKTKKQTHSKSLMSPSCRSRLLPSGDGHFSRERKREKSNDIWYYVEESTVTTKKKFAIQMSFNDAPGQQLRREKIKSLFSSIQKININMSSSSASSPLYYTFSSLSLCLSCRPFWMCIDDVRKCWDRAISFRVTLRKWLSGGKE